MSFCLGTAQGEGCPKGLRWMVQKVSELAFPNLQHSNHSRRTAIHVMCGLVADNQLVRRLNWLTSDDCHNPPAIPPHPAVLHTNSPDHLMSASRKPWT